MNYFDHGNGAFDGETDLPDSYAHLTTPSSGTGGREGGGGGGDHGGIGNSRRIVGGRGEEEMTAREGGRKEGRGRVEGVRIQDSPSEPVNIHQEPNGLEETLTQGGGRSGGSRGGGGGSGGGGGGKGGGGEGGRIEGEGKDRQIGESEDDLDDDSILEMDIYHNVDEIV